LRLPSRAYDAVVPYPRHLLNDGEQIVLDLKPHWRYFTKHIVTGVPLLFLFVIILSALKGGVRNVSMVAWAVLAVVWAAWLVIKYFQWTYTHFVVTSDRVIFRTGAIAKKGVEIPLDRISNINFHQNIIERMIGAGDLSIESAGRDGQTKFDDVRHPDAVQQEIYRQADLHARKRASWATSGAAPAAPAAPAPASVPEQLEQLASLRDRGIITAAEFESKKAQLLERM
jgi:uncharacterized membrane protein YdbT with pleckstrin-like domain